MKEVIREIEEYTNIACMNNPNSYVPVVAKFVIRFLKEVENAPATA